MLVIENLSTVMQLLAFKAARLSAFSGFRQRGTRRRTIASTFRETEEGSPLRGSSSATWTIWLEVLLVVPPRQSVHARCRVLLKRRERLVKQIDTDMV